MNGLLILAFAGVTVTQDVPMARERYVVAEQTCNADNVCTPVQHQEVYGMGMPNYNNRITSAPIGEPCLYVLEDPIETTDPDEIRRLGTWRTTPYPQFRGDKQVWGYWISKDGMYRGRTACEKRQ